MRFLSTPTKKSIGLSANTPVMTSGTPRMRAAIVLPSTVV